jgi:hypothetical protein
MVSWPTNRTCSVKSVVGLSDVIGLVLRQLVEVCSQENPRDR